MGLCLAWPATVFAACAPEPTSVNGTVDCSGTDVDGLKVDSNNTTVTIQQDATVTSVLATTVADPDQYYGSSNTITINDSGRITGGLVVHPGAAAPNASYGPNTSVLLNVAAGGAVGGGTAISLRAEPGVYGGGLAAIAIDNSGSIASSSGPAIVSNGPQAGISNLTNRATGTIGAIRSGIVTLDNRGTIDGGSDSAISLGLAGVSDGSFLPGQWSNSGTITAGGNSATLLLQSGYGSSPTIVSSGTIANTGGGAAILLAPNNPYGYATLTNEAGGTISATGNSAIVSFGQLVLSNSGTITGIGPAVAVDGGLSLTNRGTINGSVVAVDANQGASRIDLSGGGKINGDLTLGAGDDTVIVDYVPGASALSGISGSIDAGGGTNQLIYKVAGDPTISAPLAVPGSFKILGLDLADEATATLDTGFTPSGTLALTSPGRATLVNKASFTVNGPAVTEAVYAGLVAVDNRGAITANLASQYDTALQIGQGSFTNSGTIIANGGNGVNQFGGNGPFDNSGTIAASNTAVTMYGSGFTNSGTIASSGGIGVYLIGGQANSAVNSGTITGLLAGVENSGYSLANSGTIAASAGPGVAMDAYSRLANLAGGVINHGIAPGLSGTVFNVTISNAGTINGDVNLGSAFPQTSGNTFVGLDGGVVNGNLVLGTGGDRFVTSLTNTGPGAYAGVTGTISGGPNESLIYRVDADTTASLVAPGSTFSRVGYDLGNNASLVLSGGAAPASLTFSGVGKVDLTADLTGTGGAPLVDIAQVPVRASGLSALALTSHGHLSVVNADPSPFANSTVTSVFAGSSFTNAGSIVFADVSGRPTYLPTLAAIADVGGAVENAGSIVLGGGVIGISATPNSDAQALITNTGTIFQLADTADATAIAGSFALTNSGTIATGGTAVRFGSISVTTPNSVTNSGTISSSHGAAIGDDAGQNFYPVSLPNQVHNLADGTISGGANQPAIALALGAVDNAGTIVGDVVLGSPQFGGYIGSGSTYLARGGTLNGNLRFGAGDDTLLVFGSGTGVTGTIDAGGGTNTYAQAFTGSATVDAGQAVPSTFQKYGIAAFGKGTVVTVTGPDAGLDKAISFFGDGTIDNRTNINAAPSEVAGANRVNLGTANVTLGATGGLTFINEATLADGVNGKVAGFTNTGAIGSQALQFAPVELAAVDGADFTFANTGMISGPNPTTAQSFVTPTVSLGESGGNAPLRAHATVDNAGTIAGTLAVNLVTHDLTVTNSGLIAGSPSSFYGKLALSLNSSGGGSFQTVTSPDSAAAFENTAAGTLDGAALFFTTAANLTARNAGTVNGELIVTQGTVTTYVPGANGAQGTFVTPDNVSARYDNSGTVTANANPFVGVGSAFSASATTAMATNSGTITAHSPGQTAFEASNSTSDSGTLTVANSGSLSASGPGGSGLVAVAFVGSAAAANLTVTNSGAIAATGGASYVPGFYGPFGPINANPSQLLVATGATIRADGQGATSATFTNAAGATIQAGGATVGASTGRLPGAGAVPVPAAYANAGAVGVIVAADTVSFLNAGTISGGNDIVADAQTVVSVADAGIALTGTIAGGVQVNAHTVAFTNTGTITGSVALATDGASSVVNHGTINGRVSLGAGDDTFLQGITGSTGAVDGGAGTNRLTVDVTGNGDLGQTVTRFTGFGSLDLTGNGTVTVTAPIAMPTVVLDQATLTLAAGSTLQAQGPIALTAGSGASSFTNHGTVNGAIVGIDTVNDAGGTVNIAADATDNARFVNAAADSTLAVRAGTLTLGRKLVNSGLVAVSGGATLTDLAGIANLAGGRITVAGGGTINDALDNAGTVVNNGTYNADLNNFAGGSATNAAGATWTGTLTNAAGATLINQGAIIGSVINAGTFTSTRGSSVSGTVTSSGALAPAGTMTINGNVALAGGAVARFNVGQGVSDQLLVSGTLTIAPGAKLSLVAVPGNPLRPGSSIDLIVADGGISGSFATIEKLAGVAGFAIQRANRISLLGQFQADPGFGRPVNAAIDYVNSILAGGQASAALLNAFPSLLTAGGNSNAAAFAQLTPEAYASATQVGTDNGLTIAGAMRRMDAGHAAARGNLFVFGQGLGVWSRLDGSTSTGTSTATLSGGGALGGIGFGGGKASIAGFIGYLNSSQKLAGLGSSTSADGAFLGASAHFASGGLSGTVTFAYDLSRARTERQVPGNLREKSNYDLHSSTIDVTVSYAFPFGNSIQLRPQLGLTHIHTARGAATEFGSAGAFDFAVARGSNSVDFIDGGVRIEAEHGNRATFRPWLDLGARHLLSADVRAATGYLAGGPAGLTVAGVPRSRTVATVGAGFKAAAAQNVQIFADYEGTFGARGTGHNVNGGIRLWF